MAIKNGFTPYGLQIVSIAPLSVSGTQTLVPMPTGISTPLPATPLQDRKMIVLQNQENATVLIGESGNELFELNKNTVLTIEITEDILLFGVRVGVGPDGLILVWEFA